MLALYFKNLQVKVKSDNKMKIADLNAYIEMDWKKVAQAMPWDKRLLLLLMQAIILQHA